MKKVSIMVRKIEFILFLFVLTLFVVGGLKAQAKAVKPPVAFVGTWYTEMSGPYYGYYDVMEIGSDGSILSYSKYNLDLFLPAYRDIVLKMESFITYATVTSVSGSQITIAWNSTGHPNTLRLVGQSMIRSLVDILGQSKEYRYTKGQPPVRR